MSIPPPNALAYTGQVAIPFINRTFPPTSDFNKFKVPTIWIDTAGKDAYILVSLDLGTAEWVPIGGLPGEVETITVDAVSAPGTNPVVPNASQNVTFTGAQSAPGTIPNAIRTFSDAQSEITWLIQQSSTSASKNVNLNGIAHFSSTYFTNDQGFISILGTALGSTITGNSGLPLSPTAGNWNIFGLGETTTIGSGSTLSIFSPRTAKFIVDPTANLGTQQTITAALAAASSGDTIFIRPGVYTENLSLKAGVNLVAYSADALTPNVTIKGKITANYSGTATLSGIRCETNSDYCLLVSGASTILNLENCFILASNNTAISHTNGALNLLKCKGDISTTGIAFFSMSGGAIANYEYTYIDNSGASTTSNTNSQSIIFSFCAFAAPIVISGTGSINAFASAFATPSGIAITQNSTTIVAMALRNCFFLSPDNSAISIGAGGQLIIDNSIVRSGSTNGITGAGTVSVGGIVFEDVATTINTSTIIPLASYPLKGKVIQQVRQQVTGLATTTAVIPADTSIPQITEGTEFTTLAITPIYANSTLLIEFNCLLGISTAAAAPTIALFQDSIADALQARLVSIQDDSRIQYCGISYEMTASTTSSTTFRIRFGTSNAANAANINGTGGVNYYGAANMTYFIITEIAA